MSDALKTDLRNTKDRRHPTATREIEMISSSGFAGAWVLFVFMLIGFGFFLVV